MKNLRVHPEIDAFEEPLGFLPDALRRHSAGIACRTIAISPVVGRRVDCTLFFEGGAFLSTESGHALTGDLRGHPAIASVRVGHAALFVRLADEFVASLGRCLESVEGALATDGILAGKTYCLAFLDANTTKALHVGHLRNVVLGSALGGIITAAGATVERKCFVSDIGRSMCEALAGYLKFHFGEDPTQVGARTDVFVGRCYAEYVASHGGDQGSESVLDVALHRDIRVEDDVADVLHRLWIAKDPAVRHLWHEVRAWALRGQVQTLRRLGVTMDRCLFESDCQQDIERLLDLGLRQGFFARLDNGSVVYPTGKPEYPSMLLVRPDGLPTEHMRIVSLIRHQQDIGPWVTAYITIAGSEWKAPAMVYNDILAKLGPCPLIDKKTAINYGMVTIDGDKMKSSDGAAVLIDDLLDRVIASAIVRDLMPQADGAVTRDRLALTVAEMFFLRVPTEKAMEFSWDRLTNARYNPGVAVASAWCRATRFAAANDGARTQPESYRWAVLQAVRYLQLFRVSAERLDVQPLARFLINTAAEYAVLDFDAGGHRIMRRVFDGCLSSLGICPAPEALGRFRTLPPKCRALEDVLGPPRFPAQGDAPDLESLSRRGQALG